MKKLFEQQYFKVQIDNETYDYYKLHGSIISNSFKTAPPTLGVLLDIITVDNSIPVDIAKNIWHSKKELVEDPYFKKIKVSEKEWNDLYKKLYDDFRELLKKKGNYLTIERGVFSHYFKLEKIIGEKALLIRIRQEDGKKDIIEKVMLDLSVICSQEYKEITEKKWNEIYEKAK